MEAGSDTTSATLHSFILAMINYPHVLQKAQKELDEICGISRSPASADVGQADYMRAVMTEVGYSSIPLRTQYYNSSVQTLRWRPVAPGGVPHMLIQDDVYDGYHLPKGTIVFANTWSIHQDPAEYDRPTEFIPERYLSNKFGTAATQEEWTDNGQRRVTYGFGAGRRVCPGQRLAENSLVSRVT
jgi:cytochrome P450